MLQERQRLYEFGPFRLDPAQQLLTEGDRRIQLTPKAFQTLLVLVENQGRVVDKEELLQKVWPGTFVEEATLAQNIFTLRKQLRGDGGESASYIETVPKRGYRFVPAVRVEEAGDPAAAADQVVDTPASSVDETGVSSNSETQIAAPGGSGRRWGIRLVAAVVAVAAVVGVVIGQRPHSVQTRSRPMLAVLPVQNLTGDPNQEYLADGLTEELIADLGSLNPERLGVIARTSAMTYKQTHKTVQEIGRELGVDYVLESSLREGSGQVRFTAQLIQTRDQTHLWTQNYKREMADVLALQGELARTVAEEIRVDLSREVSRRLAAPRAVQPDAYDAYVRGRHHWNERTAGEVRSAIQYFQLAIERDPNFAPAYASLADSYLLLTMMREAAPSEMMPKAKDAVLKALALDDSLSDAHTVLGEITQVFGWDWAGAEKEYRRGIELDSNNANAHHQYAIFLARWAGFRKPSAKYAARSRSTQ